MFIQTQQTSSVNGSSSSSSSSSNNTVHHPSKKRKLDYNVSQPVIQHALVQSSASDYQLDNTGLQQRYSVNGANTAFSSLHNNNALQKSSPNQQTLVRASTIKLLDTYQRCGQKVGISCCVVAFSESRRNSVFSFGFFLFSLSLSESLTQRSFLRVCLRGTENWDFTLQDPTLLPTTRYSIFSRNRGSFNAATSFFFRLIVGRV
jgi:hypothetical protein